MNCCRHAIVGPVIRPAERAVWNEKHLRGVQNGEIGNRNLRKMASILGIFVAVLSAAAIPATAEASPLRWYSFEKGMEASSQQGKKAFVFFRADWCKYCHTMETETFRNPEVVAYLNENFIAVRVDTDREQELSTMFRVQGLPDTWFFSENGDVIGHRPGYIPPETFIKILKSVSNAAAEPQ